MGSLSLKIIPSAIGTQQSHLLNKMYHLLKAGCACIHDPVSLLPMKDFVSMKNWADDEKPREKLIKNGKASLSNAELLALLLSTGTVRQSALDLARTILGKFNNDLNELAKTGIKDLCKIDGIGPAKAVTIVAAIELAGRRQAIEGRESGPGHIREEPGRGCPGTFRPAAGGTPAPGDVGDARECAGPHAERLREPGSRPDDDPARPAHTDEHRWPRGRAG